MLRDRIFILVFLLCVHSLVLGLTTSLPDFDTVIKNGKIVDGTGNPWFRGDIGISGDKIVKIGRIPSEKGKTIFDLEDIQDKATFVDPHQYPEGIEYVLVNGKIVVDHGKITGKLPGRILYGPGKK